MKYTFDIKYYIIVVCLILIGFMSIFQISASCDELTGEWRTDTKGKWYRYSDGSYPKSEWKDIDGNTYYFDSTGYVHLGWLKIDNVYYYFKSDGVMARDEWVVNDQFYVDSNGVWIENASHDTDDSIKYNVTTTVYSADRGYDITTTLDLSNYKSSIESANSHYFTWVCFVPNQPYDTNLTGYVYQGICYYSNNNFRINENSKTFVTSNNETIYYNPCSTFSDSVCAWGGQSEKIVFTDAEYYFCDINSTSRESALQHIDELCCSYFNNDFSFNGIPNTYDLSSFEFDDDGNIIHKRENVLIDIPTLENCRVAHTDSMDRFEFKVLWDISDSVSEDIMKNGKIQIKTASWFTYYQFAWSSGIDFDVGYHMLDSDISLYTKNFIYKQDKDDLVIKAFAQAGSMPFNQARDLFTIKLPHKRIKKRKYPTFALRVKYVDANNDAHYSNWVLLEDSGFCDGYVANETSDFWTGSGNTSSDTVLTTDSSFDIDNSSGLYDGSSNVMVDSSGNTDLVTGVNFLSNCLVSLKEYPTFFAKFFSFLPLSDTIAMLISTLIIIVILTSVVKLII